MAKISLSEALRGTKTVYVPGRGMSTALAEYERIGGRGSPYGALETRVKKHGTDTGEAIGGGIDAFFKKFSSWLKDPDAYKARLEEDKKLSDEAKKQNVSKTELQLMVQKPMSLFGAADNYQIAVMTGIFQLMQVQTRYSVALAKSLGVKKNDMLSPVQDPKKSFLGGILSAIGRDIQKIPGVKPLVSVGKHVKNIASFLNPFTMGDRIMTASQKFGDKLQRLIMGEKSYQYMKDPKAAMKDAGLYLEDTEKLVNLTKVQANYAKEQLIVQHNIMRGVFDLNKRFGVETRFQRLDLAHDEYDGNIKTNREAEAQKSARGQQLQATYLKAASRSVLGNIAQSAYGMKQIATGAFTGLANLGAVISGTSKKVSPRVAIIQRRYKKKSLPKRDRRVLSIMFSKGRFEDFDIDELHKCLDKITARSFYDTQTGKSSPEVEALAKVVIKIMTKELMPEGEGNGYQALLDQFIDDYIKTYEYTTHLISNEWALSFTHGLAGQFEGMSGNNTPDDLNTIQKRYLARERFGGNSNIQGAMQGRGMAELMADTERDSGWSGLSRVLNPMAGVWQNIRNNKITSDIRYEMANREFRNPVPDQIANIGGSNIVGGDSSSDLDGGFNLNSSVLKATANIAHIYVGRSISFKRGGIKRASDDSSPANNDNNINADDDIIDLGDPIKIGRGLGRVRRKWLKRRNRAGNADNIENSDILKDDVDITELTYYEKFKNVFKNIFSSDNKEKIKDKYKDHPVMIVLNAIRDKLTNMDDREEEANNNRTRLSELKERLSSKLKNAPKNIASGAMNVVAKIKDKYNEENEKDAGSSIGDFLKGFGGGLFGAAKGLLGMVPNVGLLGGLLLGLFGTDTGQKIYKGIGNMFSSALDFIKERLGNGGLEKMLEKIGDFLDPIWGCIKENIVKAAGKTWDFAKENPLDFSLVAGAAFLTMFPGQAGKLLVGGLVKAAGTLMTNPAGFMYTAAIGGVLYNVVKSYTETKEDGGGFGTFIKKLLVGGEAGLGNVLGKAATWGTMGATIGTTVFPGLGTLGGFLVGAAIGSIIGGLGENNIDTMQFDGAKEVCEKYGWKPGSVANMFAMSNIARAFPFVGPPVFGWIGAIIDDLSDSFPFGKQIKGFFTSHTKEATLQDEAEEKRITEQREAQQEYKEFNEGRKFKVKHGDLELELKKEEKEEYEKLKDDTQKQLYLKGIQKRIEAVKQKRDETKHLGQNAFFRGIDELVARFKGDKDTVKNIEKARARERADQERINKQLGKKEIQYDAYGAPIKEEGEPTDATMPSPGAATAAAAAAQGAAATSSSSPGDFFKRTVRQGRMCRDGTGGAHYFDESDGMVDSFKRGYFKRDGSKTIFKELKDMDPDFVNKNLENFKWAYEQQKNGFKDLKFAGKDYVLFEGHGLFEDEDDNGNPINPSTNKAATSKLGDQFYDKNFLRWGAAIYEQHLKQQEELKKAGSSISSAEAAKKDSATPAAEAAAAQQQAVASSPEMMDKHKSEIEKGAKELEKRLSDGTAGARDVKDFFITYGYGNMLAAKDKASLVKSLDHINGITPEEKQKMLDEINKRFPDENAKADGGVAPTPIGEIKKDGDADPNFVGPPAPPTVKESSDPKDSENAITGDDKSNAQASAGSNTGSGDNAMTGSDGGTQAGGTKLNWIESAIAKALRGTLVVGQGIAGALGMGNNDGGSGGGSSGGGGGDSYGGGSADISGVDTGDLGAVSAKFESRGDSSTVAWDRKGGTSYGKYQFAAKVGGMQGFVNWLPSQGALGKEVHDRLMNAAGGKESGFETGGKTGAPVDEWKKLVSENKIGDLEKKYSFKAYYEDPIKKLPSEIREFIEKAMPLKQMAFSTIIQHGPGGGPKILKKAYRPGITAEEYVKNVYAERTKEHPLTARRYREECDFVLTLLGGGKKSGGGGNSSGSNSGGNLSYGGGKLSGGAEMPTGGDSSGGIDLTRVKFRGNLHSVGSAKNLSSFLPGAPNISSSALDFVDNGGEKMVWPSKHNVITSPLGPRNGPPGASKFHPGIDVRARTGDPIFAAMKGKVIGVGGNDGIVAVEHSNGLVSRYVHMIKSKVNVNDQVEAGQQIGVAGGMGGGKPNRWVPHLHFEFHKGGKYVDPEAVYYQYGKKSGKGYNPQYSGIGANRQLPAKLSGGYMGRVNAKGGPMDNDTPASNSSIKNDNSSLMTGSTALRKGPEIGDASDNIFGGTTHADVRKNVSEYVAAKNTSGGSNAEIVSELKKLTAVTAVGAATSKQSPQIVPISTQSEGSANNAAGGSTPNLGDAGVDSAINKIFTQIGSIFSSLNIAHTNVGISTI